MIQIRRATQQDASMLAAFAERTFRETFSAFNSAEDMDQFVAETFGEGIQAREIADPTRRVLLALEAGELAGFCHLRDEPAHASIKGPRPIHLRNLYVDSRWHGKKLAHRLLQEAIALSQSEGFKTLWLGVWEKNLRAMAFYRKWDFVEVGDVVFQLGSDPQRDLVYTRAI